MFVLNGVVVVAVSCSNVISKRFQEEVNKEVDRLHDKVDEHLRKRKIGNCCLQMINVELEQLHIKLKMEKMKHEMRRW
jgi:hypothetical protein